MKDLIIHLRLGAVIGFLGLLAACGDDDNGQQPPPSETSMANHLQERQRFSILVDALGRTDLLSLLAGDSLQLTLFAPNNPAFQNAFQTLGVPDLDGLETLWGNDGLRKLLLYHMIGQELHALDFTNDYWQTLAENDTGYALSLYTDITTGVGVNGAPQVITADINATNGIIHETDAVLLPLSVLGLIEVNSGFSILVEAIAAADDQLDTLFNSSQSQLTLFAPDDAAFIDLFNDYTVADLDEFIDSVGTSNLTQILKYHALNGTLRAEDMTDETLQTLEGGNITISTTGGISITDGSAQSQDVTRANIQGTNGVVHRIEAVLKPQ